MGTLKAVESILDGLESLCAEAGIDLLTLVTSRIELASKRHSTGDRGIARAQHVCDDIQARMPGVESGQPPSFRPDPSSQATAAQQQPEPLPAAAPRIQNPTSVPVRQSDSYISIHSGPEDDAEPSPDTLPGSPMCEGQVLQPNHLGTSVPASGVLPSGHEEKGKDTGSGSERVEGAGALGEDGESGEEMTEAAMEAARRAEEELVEGLQYCFVVRGQRHDIQMNVPEALGDEPDALTEWSAALADTQLMTQKRMALFSQLGPIREVPPSFCAIIPDPLITAAVVVGDDDGVPYVADASEGMYDPEGLVIAMDYDQLQAEKAAMEQEFEGEEEESEDEWSSDMEGVEPEAEAGAVDLAAVLERRRRRTGGGGADGGGGVSGVEQVLSQEPGDVAEILQDLGAVWGRIWRLAKDMPLDNAAEAAQEVVTGHLGNVFTGANLTWGLQKLEFKVRARQIVTILQGVAEVVEALAAAWTAKEQPRLSADAWAIWHSARRVHRAHVLGQGLGGVRAEQHSQLELWQWDLAHHGGRMVDVVHELTKQHISAPATFTKDKHRLVASAVESTLHDILENRYMVQLASQPEEPPRPAPVLPVHKDKRHSAALGPDASLDNDHDLGSQDSDEDEESDEEDSDDGWMVNADEPADKPQDQQAPAASEPEEEPCPSARKNRSVLLVGPASWMPKQRPGQQTPQQHEDMPQQEQQGPKAQLEAVLQQQQGPELQQEGQAQSQEQEHQPEGQEQKLQPDQQEHSPLQSTQPMETESCGPGGVDQGDDRPVDKGTAPDQPLPAGMHHADDDMYLAGANGDHVEAATPGMGAQQGAGVPDASVGSAGKSACKAGAGPSQQPSSSLPGTPYGSTAGGTRLLDGKQVLEPGMEVDMLDKRRRGKLGLWRRGPRLVHTREGLPDSWIVQDGDKQTVEDDHQLRPAVVLPEVLLQCDDNWQQLEPGKMVEICCTQGSQVTQRWEPALVFRSYRQPQQPGGPPPWRYQPASSPANPPTFQNPCTSEGSTAQARPGPAVLPALAQHMRHAIPAELLHRTDRPLRVRPDLGPVHSAWVVLRTLSSNRCLYMTQDMWKVSARPCLIYSNITCSWKQIVTKDKQEMKLAHRAWRDRRDNRLAAASNRHPPGDLKRFYVRALARNPCLCLTELAKACNIPIKPPRIYQSRFVSRQAEPAGDVDMKPREGEDGHASDVSREIIEILSQGDKEYTPRSATKTRGGAGGQKRPPITGRGRHAKQQPRRSGEVEPVPEAVAAPAPAPPKAKVVVVVPPQPLFPDRDVPTVAGRFVSVLKEHQFEGLRFLWKNLVDEHAESHPDRESAGGAILAHTMGLGKSLTTVSLLHTLFSFETKGRALVVTPPNVLCNFHDEFLRWLPPAGERNGQQSLLNPDKVFRITKMEQIEEKVRKWYEYQGSVLLVSSWIFQTFVVEARNGEVVKAGASTAPGPEGENAEATPAPAQVGMAGLGPTLACGATAGEAKARKLRAAAPDVQAMLLEGASVVIVDEAHELKNDKSKYIEAMDKVQTRRRVALTGYPLQNNLNEYLTMINWARTDSKPDSEWYRDDLVIPINDGRKKDATKHKKAKMKLALAMLHSFTEGFVQARTDDVLQAELAAAGVTKTEHVIKLSLTPEQGKLYNEYTQIIERQKVKKSLLRDIEIFYKICNAPQALKPWLNDFKDGKVLDAEVAGEDVQLVIVPSQPTDATPINRQASGTARGRHKKAEGGKEIGTMPEAVVQELEAKLQELLEAKLPTGGQGQWTEEPKMDFVLALLHECKAANEKLVVFTQSVPVLTQLQQMLKQHFGKHISENQGWWQISGKATSLQRSKSIKSFQKHEGFGVFLLTTKAGALGINLTTAQRLVVFDMTWNPVHTAQAMARVHRMGQTKPTFIYRLMYKNTMEEQIYKVNVDKEELVRKVVDKNFKVRKMVDAERQYYVWTPPGDMLMGEQQLMQCKDAMLQRMLAAGGATAAAGPSGSQGARRVRGLLQHVAEYHPHNQMMSEDQEGMSKQQARKLMRHHFKRSQPEPEGPTKNHVLKRLRKMVDEDQEPPVQDELDDLLLDLDTPDEVAQPQARTLPRARSRGTKAAQHRPPGAGGPSPGPAAGVAQAPTPGQAGEATPGQAGGSTPGQAGGGTPGQARGATPGQARVSTPVGTAGLATPSTAGPTAGPATRPQGGVGFRFSFGVPVQHAVPGTPGLSARRQPEPPQPEQSLNAPIPLFTPSSAPGAASPTEARPTGLTPTTTTPTSTRGMSMLERLRAASAEKRQGVQLQSSQNTNPAAGAVGTTNGATSGAGLGRSGQPAADGSRPAAPAGRVDSRGLGGRSWTAGSFPAGATTVHEQPRGQPVFGMPVAGFGVHHQPNPAPVSPQPAAVGQQQQPSPVAKQPEPVSLQQQQQQQQQTAPTGTKRPRRERIPPVTDDSPHRHGVAPDPSGAPPAKRNAGEAQGARMPAPAQAGPGLPGQAQTAPSHPKPQPAWVQPVPVPCPKTLPHQAPGSASALSRGTDAASPSPAPHASGVVPRVLGYSDSNTGHEASSRQANQQGLNSQGTNQGAAAATIGAQAPLRTRARPLAPGQDAAALGRSPMPEQAQAAHQASSGMQSGGQQPKPSPRGVAPMLPVQPPQPQLPALHEFQFAPHNGSPQRSGSSLHRTGSKAARRHSEGRPPNSTAARGPKPSQDMDMVDLTMDSE